MSIVKSELYKLTIFKPFYICLSICFAIVALFGLSIQGVGVGGIGAVLLIEQTLDLPFLPFLFAAFVSLFVCAEFHSGAVKNYVSKGCNRVGIYVSKLAVCGIAVLTMYTAYVVLFGIMGTVFWGFDPQGIAAFSNITAMILGEGLLLFAYSSVFVLVSMGLRRGGASIAVNLCIVSFLPTILQVGSFILGGDIMLEEYWISAHITALATLTPESGTVPRGILVGLCYIAGGTLVGSVLFKNVDIK